MIYPHCCLALRHSLHTMRELGRLKRAVLLLLLMFNAVIAPHDIIKPEDGDTTNVDEWSPTSSPTTVVTEIKVWQKNKIDTFTVEPQHIFYYEDKDKDHYNLMVNTNDMDFETTDSYTVTLNAVWTDGSEDSVTFTVKVTDQPDGPSLDAATYTKTIDEENEPNLVVFQHSVDYFVSDVDDTVFTYQMAGNDSSFFHLYPNGTVTLVNQTDYERGKTSFSFTLSVRDPSLTNPPAEATFTLNLRDIDDNCPECIPNVLTAGPLNENPGTGVIVKTLSCTDADNGGNGLISYTILSGADGMFSVVNNQVVTTGQTFDVDTESSYTISVLATSGPDCDATATVTVQIEGRTPVFANVDTSYDVPENTMKLPVVILSATDNDPGDFGRVYYSLVSAIDSATGADKSEAFYLAERAGELHLVKEVDRETVKSVTLKVRAQDGGTPSKSSTFTFTVNVLNDNDNDPVFSSNLHRIVIPEAVALAMTWPGFQVIATDADLPSVDLVYSCTSSNGPPGSACDTNRFQIDSNTGLLLQVSAIDLDDPSQDCHHYILKIQASDQGEPVISSRTIRTAVTTVVITIEPTNDHSPIFDLLPSSITVDEPVPSGTSVINVTATDKDRDYGQPQKITYSITGGNTNDAFVIDPDTGELLALQDLDYESGSTSYSLVIEATDDGSPPRTSSFSLTISVSNSNEHTPTCSFPPSVEVSEELANEEVIVIPCSDADADETLTYSLTNGLSEFHIDPLSGRIFTLMRLDFETQQAYTLTVLVQDSSGWSALRRTTTLTVKVRVLPVNDHGPVFAPVTYSVVMDENVPGGTYVTTVSATDGDPAGTPHGEVVYRVESGNDRGWFVLQETTGQITTSPVTLDRETSSTHTLIVVATDNPGNPSSQRSDSATVVITLRDVNDNAPVCHPVTYQVRIQEPSTPEASVLMLIANDEDDASSPNAQLTLSIANGNTGNVFKMDGFHLKLQTEVDYDSRSSYILTVNVSDGGSPPLSSHCFVHVVIEATADHPPVMTTPSQTITIREDVAVSTVIFDVDASDADVGVGSVVEYFIISGNDDGHFMIISSTGELRVRAPLDFDTPPQVHSLMIEARDDSGLSDTMQVNVQLTDLNDEAPAFAQSLHRFFVAEDAPVGTVLGAVFADDADAGLNGTVSYTITAFDGPADFRIHSISGEIAVARSLDCETNSDYGLTIVAMDGGYPFFSSSTQVLIHVTDVNDNAPFFTPDHVTTSVSEDVTSALVMVVTSAWDDDCTWPNNAIIHSFWHPEFSFDVSSLELYTSLALDRETLSSYQLVIEATDKGSLPLTGCLTIHVTVSDVNDNAPVISGTYASHVPEDVGVNFVVDHIVATDADIGDNARLNYAIVAGNIGDAFFVTPNSGRIQVRRSLDSEVTQSYQLVVQVSDHGSPTVLTATTTFTVTITDINDNPPVWGSTSYSFSVTEGVTVGTVVGQVIATDADTTVPNAYLTYTDETGITSPFKVDGATGEIIADAAIDRESASSHSLLLRAADGGNPVLQAFVNVTIEVTDVNDNPPEFSASTYTAHVIEHATIGTSVLDVDVTDADDSDSGSVTLSIDSSTTHGAEAESVLEVSASGVIKVKADIIRKNNDPLEFVVLAVDGGSPALTSTASVAIYVLDSNDPPVFTNIYYNFEVIDNATCQQKSVLVNLTAFDDDTGVEGHITYSMESTEHQDVFWVDAVSGEFYLKPSAHLIDGYTYYVNVSARDGGTPSLTASVFIRLDVLDPEGRALLFKMCDVTVQAFRYQEARFLQQVQAVIREQDQYSTAVVRLLCVLDNSPDVDVWVYFLEEDVTDSVDHRYWVKNYMAQPDARTLFTLDAEGTPGHRLSGSEWDSFRLCAVHPYDYDTPAWYTTPGWMVCLFFIAVLSLVLIGLGLYMTCRFCRCARCFCCHPLFFRHRSDPRPRSTVSVSPSSVSAYPANRPSYLPPVSNRKTAPSWRPNAWSVDTDFKG